MGMRTFWWYRKLLDNHLWADPYLTDIYFLLTGKIRGILWKKGYTNTSLTVTRKVDYGDSILFTWRPFFLFSLKWTFNDMDTRTFKNCENKRCNNLSIDPYLTYIQFLWNG
jgi:hypothetical protein